jgi:predicted N-acetyltransferase YhbS
MSKASKEQMLDASASSDSDEGALNDDGDDGQLEPELRPAKIDDVPAILALLQSNLIFKLEAGFEAKLKKALATAEWPDAAGGRFACVIATLEDMLVGVVVSYTFNLAEAVANGKTTYELLQSRKQDTEAVMVKVLAVDRPHRRGGLGTELLYAGVRSLAIQSPTAGAVS